MQLLNYSEPLYRPPSEARSLILQPTIGCSWNKCAFCEMYSSKKFTVVDEEIIFKQIESLKPYAKQVKKVFLADGNAMVLSYDRLMRILEKLHSVFPKIIRISAYALPSDISAKNNIELKNLRDAGLNMLYTGIESGDDELLNIINKRETSESTIAGLAKAKEANIKLSVMILNGLGGSIYSSQHAINSALIVNRVHPEYLSTLVLSFPFGIDHYKNRFKGEFYAMDKKGLINEMGEFISNLQLNNTVFRSDHASNYLVLKGILNRDKEALLLRINDAVKNSDREPFHPKQYGKL